MNIVLAFTDEARERFIKSTAEDFEMQLLKQVVLRGWPEDSKKLPEAVRKYANFKEEITFEQGLLFKAHKVIVPRIEINKIVRDLHSGHPGVASSLARARQSIYWYGQSNDIRDYVEKCTVCQQTQRSNAREPQLQRTVPEYPFQLVSTDIFNFKGDEYVLIADHYSGFMDFRKLKSSNSAEVIDHMRQWFSLHGIPETLESDGGPQYMSKRIAEFASKWQFNHRVSSPYYPRSNGFAERNVQTAKNLLKRCWLDGTDICLALLMLRNSPRNDVLGSPCQRLYSRATCTIMPMTAEDLKPKIVVGVSRELRDLRIRQGIYADRVATPLESLRAGDSVRLKTGHREWIGAKIVKETPYPRSVIVETNDGKLFRRNTFHLHKTKASIGSPTNVERESSQRNTSAKPSDVSDEAPPNRTLTSPKSIEVFDDAPPNQRDTSPKSTEVSNDASGGRVGRPRKLELANAESSTTSVPVTTRSGRQVKPVERLGIGDFGQSARGKK